MSKMSQLAAEIEELRHCGEILIGISDSLRDLFSGSDKADEPKDAPASEKPATKKCEQEKKAPALADVRALLAEKSRDGFTAQVRAIITAHGANKLSEIDPAEFPSIMKEAEVLGNG
jgi:hypothetical protein